MKKRKTHHPIIFSWKMVLAILTGRKTVTRRIVQHPGLIEHLNMVERHARKADLADCLHRSFNDDGPYLCPYGKVGDTLWVRENFGYHKSYDDVWLSNIPPLAQIYYRADGFPEFVKRERPSIHLAEDKARICLEITDIRIERLQNITKEDAIAEGIKLATLPDPDSFLGADFDPAVTYYHDYSDAYFGTSDPIESFTSLWIDINSIESWEANPWVWVIKFKVIYTTGIPVSADQEAAAV